MNEVLTEIALEYLRYNMFTNRFNPRENHVFLFFGDYNIPSTVNYLDKANIVLTKVKYFHTPLLQTTYRGVVVNTKKFYADLLKTLEEKKVPFRLVKNLPRKLQNSSIIIDIQPILNMVSEKLEEFPVSTRFERYFELVDSYIRKYSGYAKNQNLKFTIVFQFSTSYGKINFIRDLVEYLARESFTLPINYQGDIYCLVELNGDVVYTKLGENNIINKNVIRRILRQMIRVNEEAIKKAAEEAKEINVEKEVDKFLNKNGIKSEDVKNNIKTIVKQYVASNPHEKKKLVEEPERVIEKAFKEIAGVDVNISEEPTNIKEKILHVGKTFTRTQTVEPHVVFEHAQLIPTEDIKVDTTIADRHKREFEERLDFYVEKIFKVFETGSAPVKVKKIQKQLFDDNRSRFYEYTITVVDKSGEEYDLKVRLPALVYDRYFKLNGKTYILVNQLFLRPITKAKHNSARFLSNYATVTLELRNTKVQITNINELLDHIIVKYPKIVESYAVNEEEVSITPEFEPIKYSFVKFKNGYTFYGYNPLGAGYFVIDKISDDVYTEYNSNEGKLIRVEGDEEHELKYKLREYIIESILSNVEKILGYDPISSGRNLPYVQIHIAGVKMPFIKYLILYYGLVGALSKLGIKYSVDNKKDNNAYYTVKFAGRTYVNIYPKLQREKYIINGLRVSQIDFSKVDFEDFEKNENMRRKIFADQYGAYSVRNFDLIRQNIVDTITTELLEYTGKDVDFDTILCNDVLKALFSDIPYSPVDLRVTRARLAEILLNILYKQISMAKNDYEIRSVSDETAKIYIDRDYVIRQILQGEPTLQYTEPVNPVEELNIATRIVPTGIGGVPRQAIQLAHRLIPFEKDKSGKIITPYFGNISALDTNEYERVGVNQELTYQALISDKFGIFGLRHDIKDLKFETLGIGESLAPWLSSIDHDRIVKLAQQIRQTLPINNPTPPIVMSGAEFFIPQLASRRFVIKAEKDGVVEEVKENEYIVVKYEDGTRKLYDIRPRTARIKRGRYLPLDIIVNVKEGQKIRKGQIIAGTNQVNTGIYTYGRNVVVAVLPYLGGTFEDGWAVSEDTLEKFSHKIFKEVNVIIPPDASVLKVVDKEGVEVKEGEPLVELSFVKQGSAEELINTYSDEDLGEFTKEANTVVVKSPVNGIIREIRVYINGKVDAKVMSLWNKITRKLKRYIDKAVKINGEDDLSCIDNIDTSMFRKGNHKYKSRRFEGARIMYLIETERKPILNDKFVFRGGNKGTVTYIIPKDKKPIALDTKLKIDWIHNPLSIIGRKNANILLELGVGKVLYFLNKKAKELVEKGGKTSEIKKLVLDIYGTLDVEGKFYNRIKEKLDNISERQFRELCKRIEPLERPLFYWIAAPFSKMPIRRIVEAAEILGIPLEEKVYIPELGITTSNPVTVGVAYVTILEHSPDVMIGYRSVEKYSRLTGQAVKGQSNVGVGGARVDELTLTGLIDYLGKDSKLIEELYTVQADDHTAKQDVMFQIIQTGKAPENYKRDTTRTKDLLRRIFIARHIDLGI